MSGLFLCYLCKYNEKRPFFDVFYSFVSNCLLIFASEKLNKINSNVLKKYEKAKNFFG